MTHARKQQTGRPKYRIAAFTASSSAVNKLFSVAGSSGQLVRLRARPLIMLNFTIESNLPVCSNTPSPLSYAPDVAIKIVVCSVRGSFAHGECEYEDYARDQLRTTLPWWPSLVKVDD